jgi:peptidoglycan/xylan/chitin deacetylase (PgdA/CDA1 family)
MTTWIFKTAALVLALTAGVPCARADIITRLPTREPIVALTFDACETRTPVSLDHKIADYLVGAHIPFTVFVSGRFARHNRADLAWLAKQDLVELENHSLNHDNHMDQWDDEAIRRDVAAADSLLSEITGRHTRYFRFPAGNVNARAVADVEAMGYHVVHWSFASGDPIPTLTPAALTDWVLTKTRPGSILIFHINGRGRATGDALPGIVAALEAKHYRFVRLDSLLP